MRKKREQPDVIVRSLFVVGAGQPLARHGQRRAVAVLQAPRQGTRDVQEERVFGTGGALALFGLEKLNDRLHDLLDVVGEALFVKVDGRFIDDDVVRRALGREREGGEVRQLDRAVAQRLVVVGFIQAPAEGFGGGGAFETRADLPAFDGRVHFVDGRRQIDGDALILAAEHFHEGGARV